MAKKKKLLDKLFSRKKDKKSEKEIKVEEKKVKELDLNQPAAELKDGKLVYNWVGKAVDHKVEKPIYDCPNCGNKLNELKDSEYKCEECGKGYSGDVAALL